MTITGWGVHLRYTPEDDIRGDYMGLGWVECRARTLNPAAYGAGGDLWQVSESLHQQQNLKADRLMGYHYSLLIILVLLWFITLIINIIISYHQNHQLLFVNIITRIMMLLVLLLVAVTQLLLLRMVSMQS